MTSTTGSGLCTVLEALSNSLLKQHTDFQLVAESFVKEHRVNEMLGSKEVVEALSFRTKQPHVLLAWDGSNIIRSGQSTVEELKNWLIREKSHMEVYTGQDVDMEPSKSTFSVQHRMGEYYRKPRSKDVIVEFDLGRTRLNKHLPPNCTLEQLPRALAQNPSLSLVDTKRKSPTGSVELNQDASPSRTAKTIRGKRENSHEGSASGAGAILKINSKTSGTPDKNSIRNSPRARLEEANERKSAPSSAAISKVHTNVRDTSRTALTLEEIFSEPSALATLDAPGSASVISSAVANGKAQKGKSASRKAGTENPGNRSDERKHAGVVVKKATTQIIPQRHSSRLARLTQDLNGAVESKPTVETSETTAGGNSREASTKESATTHNQKHAANAANATSIGVTSTSGAESSKAPRPGKTRPPRKRSHPSEENVKTDEVIAAPKGDVETLSGNRTRSKSPRWTTQMVGDTAKHSGEESLRGEFLGNASVEASSSIRRDDDVKTQKEHELSAKKKGQKSTSGRVDVNKKDPVAENGKDVSATNFPGEQETPRVTGASIAIATNIQVPLDTSSIPASSTKPEAQRPSILPPAAEAGAQSSESGIAASSAIAVVQRLALSKEAFELPPINMEDILSATDSALLKVDLRDVLSLDVFLNDLSIEDRAVLYQMLPETDRKDGETVAKLFRQNMQFASALTHYQRLLSSGSYDPNCIAKGRSKRRRAEGWSDEKERNLEAFYGYRLDPRPATKEAAAQWSDLDRQVLEARVAMQKRIQPLKQDQPSAEASQVDSSTGQQEKKEAS